MENVITLSKLIGPLLLFCPPPHCIDFENFKNTRNELARPVMGTICLVLVGGIDGWGGIKMLSPTAP